MKYAILQVADTGPLESLVTMFRAIGIECFLPSNDLKRRIRKEGCDTVLDVDTLVKSWGYDNPLYLPEAGFKEFTSPEFLYVDVKAHRNGPRLWNRFSGLKDRTLWYRINGGYPERVKDCGDEVDPPCPVLTPNLWYRENGPWKNKAYSCYPPFYRIRDYYPIHGRKSLYTYTPPVCLVHNLSGWGYGALMGRFREELGVRCYGVSSPDGLLLHKDVPGVLGDTLAMVHLKSSDAPGYALYEALAAGCPIVCTRRLIWRNHMEELFTPGETCLVFDRPTHDPLTERDVEECFSEASSHLQSLKDPITNLKIGMGGLKRLEEVMWNPQRDSESLHQFITKHFKN